MKAEQILKDNVFQRRNPLVKKEQKGYIIVNIPVRSGLH
jgi:hypothetical protein